MLRELAQLLTYAARDDSHPSAGVGVFSHRLAVPTQSAQIEPESREPRRSWHLLTDEKSG